MSSDNSKVDLSVGFSTAQQHALVGHAFFNEEFFLKCKSHVKSEWLTGDIYTAHIYQELSKFYDEYKMMPRSGTELFSEPFFASQNATDLEKYKNTLVLCYEYSQQFTLDLLRPKIADFIKMMQVREQSKYLTREFNKSNYDKGVEAARNIVKIWNDINFEANPYVDFDDAITIFAKKDSTEEEVFSTGSNELDTMLGGGLFPCGNMAVLAPTFTGKSRFLITLARHVIVQGKKVLFMIHEDNPEKVKQRILSAIVGFGVREIRAIINDAYTDPMKDLGYRYDGMWTPQDRLELKALLVAELEAAKQLLKENLIFLPWQKSGKMFVEDVVEEVKRIDLEQRAKTGRGFDLIIDDYPALLHSRMRHETDRVKLAYVYQCFNDLANELKTFCVYAVQVNRHAAKEMKTGKAEQAIGLEDVSESFQIAMNAMSAVSLNRTEDDQKLNLLRIAVIKARDSMGNNMLVTRSAYNEGNLYGNPRMYAKHGRMLGFGLEAAHEKSSKIYDASTLDANLKNIIDWNTLSTLADETKLPNIVKKLKGIGNPLHVPVPVTQQSSLPNIK